MSDNITTPVASGTVMATKDLGARHLPLTGLADEATGADALGVVVDAPAPFTILGRLKAIATALAGNLAVTGTFWQATQPVSAASLPLPTGAATAAKQDTGNSSLANVEPAGTAVAVTPSDSTVVAFRGIYVGTAGDVAVTVGGAVVTFKSVPAGMILPVKATKVMATNTTASNLVGLA